MFGGAGAARAALTLAVICVCGVSVFNYYKVFTRGSVNLDDPCGAFFARFFGLHSREASSSATSPGPASSLRICFFDLPAQFLSASIFVRDFPGLFSALVDEAAYITNFLGEGLAFVRGKLTSSHGVPHSGTRPSPPILVRSAMSLNKADRIS